MPTIAQVAEKLDVLTTDFTHIRWIGDREGIEKQTKTWDKIIVNRERKTPGGMTGGGSRNFLPGASFPLIPARIIASGRMAISICPSPVAP